MTRRALWLVAMAIWSAAPAAQSVFRTSTTGVEVDVRVRDKGRPVPSLGLEDFELRDNAYKPYACGLVVHPAIDGCSQLQREFHPSAESIAAVRVRVAPLVLDLCNKKDLRRALESKYSIYHACAIGLVRGKGGLNEFTEAALADPQLAHVRGVTTAIADPAITEDQVHVEVTLRDGRKLVKFVERSLGNVHQPLSDAQLTEKFVDQAVLALPRAQVDAVLERCWRIGELKDVGELARGTRPEQASKAAQRL
jgi:2-methylcitrate dehydratase PrpD